MLSLVIFGLASAHSRGFCISVAIIDACKVQITLVVPEAHYFTKNV